MKLLIALIMVCCVGCVSHKDVATAKGEMAAHVMEVNRLNKLEARILRHANRHFVYKHIRYQAQEVEIDRTEDGVHYGRMQVLMVEGGRLLVEELHFAIRFKGYMLGPPLFKEE